MTFYKGNIIIPQVMITPIDIYSATVLQGTWANVDLGDGKELHRHILYNSSAANGDGIQFVRPMPRGNYYVRSRYPLENSSGIFDLYIDDALVGTYDGYSSGEVLNSGIISVSEFEVNHSSLHTIKITVNGKNGSSSGYTVRLTSLLFIKLPDYHQGAWDNSGFYQDYYPYNFSYSRMGWTPALYNADGSVMSYVDGKIQFTFDRPNANNKSALFVRPALANVLKNSVFELCDKFRYTSLTTSYAAQFGLLNSGSTTYRGSTNSIMSYVDSAGKPYFDIQDSTRTLDQASGSNSDIAINTDYWRRISGNGTVLKCDFYSTENLFNAGGNGDVRSLSVNVSDVGGTVTCDRIGYCNYDDGGGAGGTQVIQSYKVNSNVAKWYFDKQ